MTDDERIAMAARQCRDPRALDGDLKIRLAAAASGHTARDDGAGDKKIRAAAAQAGLVVDDGGASDRKIRRAAGLSVEEPLEKAMSAALDALADALHQPLRLSPPAAPARQLPVRPVPPPRRLAHRPSPSASRPMVVPPPAPPPRFDGPLGYWDFRDQLAGDIRRGRVRATAERFVAHAAEHYGVGADVAAEWTERFLSGVQRDLDRRGA